MKNDKFIQDIFGIVPISLLKDYSHKGTVLSAYVSIASFQGGSESAFPSIDKIAERANLSNKAVISAMKTLVEDGWVERKRRYGTTNVYYVKTKAREKTDKDTVDKEKYNKSNLKQYSCPRNSDNYTFSDISYPRNSDNNSPRNSDNILKEHIKITDKKNRDSSPQSQIPEANLLTNSNYGTLIHPIKNHFKEVLNKQSYLNGFRESYSCGKSEMKAIDDYLKTELEELGKPDFGSTLNKAKTFIDNFFELLAKDEATRQDEFFNPSLSTVLGGKRNQWILRYLELDKSTKKTEKVKVESKGNQKQAIFDKMLKLGYTTPESRLKYFSDYPEDSDAMDLDFSYETGEIRRASKLYNFLQDNYSNYKNKLSEKDKQLLEGMI